MKGKERKEQERKGKERKEKERKGKLSNWQFFLSPCVIALHMCVSKR